MQYFHCKKLDKYFILYITTNPLRSNKNIYIPMYTTKIYELLQTE